MAAKWRHSSAFLVNHRLKPPFMATNPPPKSAKHFHCTAAQINIFSFKNINLNLIRFGFTVR
ncbi:hypothetical protein EFU42_09825 [Vibrio cholerae]|nr:hypothetical protein [Vibrio cholerae]EGR4127962.1 hypothetical protein [Vibrio cholerae]